MPLDEKPPNPSPDTDSLVKRLAGPSTTKAGLAKDQSEINRVIAEASKGSKFYENEKRKDKDLTERIARILKHRDEVLKIDSTEPVQIADSKRKLVKLESQRDLSQTIVHVDMDAFYASVELLDDPSLEGKAFASYEARKYGVRSGMPSFIAKKLCPDLILVENHFHRYMELSKKVMNIFRRYDPSMCAAGCDEGYLNITAYCRDQQLTADECVRQMRETVYQETKLTVSAGIAPNKNKPNGQFTLDFEPRAIKAFMRNLSIRKIPGVGRVNERLLDSIGIKTCGDIYTHRVVVSLMDKEFGLQFLLQTYLGIASNVVQPGQREERKSIGAERTFHPLGNQDAILCKLEEVAAELESDMTSGGWTGKTVTLKFKLDTYQVFTRAKSFDRWVSTKKEDLYAVKLLMPEMPLTLRLIGLRVTKLKDLRVESEKKASGIKRFFQSANETSPPRKKQRVETEPSDDEELRLSQDGFEDSMPGFHEHDVDESELSMLQSNSVVASLPQPTEDLSMQTCPICGKSMRTDNQGLNAHIDFCLSKDAIREAQASSSAPSPKKSMIKPKSNAASGSKGVHGRK
ncbi:hypothetical protein IEO21_05470 [Rhodonia placenta]|uniref:DNA polymerase kappa n=1 Tax=Rhodonia placenta TaxID=104341 RepID=A0A8H7P2B6_9APHY|nr:hypothetical protein IEO21_05470 [Postia placenta]